MSGPLFRGKSAAEAEKSAKDWLARVGLTKFLHHYPHQLSGGMRKRVSLAQTFINEPEILLMDEPFSALDVQTRTVMHEELLKLWAERQASVVFVTHDLEEAVALADKVYVLTAGPATVKSVYYDRPAASARRLGDPLRAELHRLLQDDLGRPSRRGRNQLSPRRRSGMKGGLIMANTALEAGNAPIFRAGTSDAEIEAAAMKAIKRRKYVVLFWQVAILVAILGLWQLASDLHWIDPFFYSSPTAIGYSALRMGHGRHRKWFALVSSRRHHGRSADRLRHRFDHRRAGRRGAWPQQARLRYPVDLHQGDQLDPACRSGADLRHDHGPRRLPPR